jgi:hypothetical protein
MENKQNIRWIIIISMISFLSEPSHAANCVNIVAKIGYKINSIFDSNQLNKSPWMNISWLKQHLGNAKPQSKPNQNFEYKWQCDRDNYLIAETDNASNLIQLSGKYNSDQGEGTFEYTTSIIVPQISTSNPFIKENNVSNNPLPPTTSAQQKSNQMTIDFTTKPIVIAPSNPAASILSDLPNYNKHYNTNIQTFDQLLDDVKSRVSKYSESVLQCTEGTYAYPSIDVDTIVYQSTHITKSSNGNCLIDTTVSLGELGNTFTKCDFKASDLPVYADSVKDAAYITGNEQENEKTKNTITDTACKTTTSGLLNKLDKGNTTQ